MNRFDLDSRDWLDSPERKRDYNRRHFAAAAAGYDRATIAMSLGRDRAWKKALVAGLPDLTQPRCLDLACGTGDICELLAQRYPEADIIGLDLTPEMLILARERCPHSNIHFIAADMTATGLPDAGFDLITGSYALRNAPDLDRALAEIARLLRPGGHAAFLDFALAESPLGRRVQYHLLRNWCGFWGWVLSGSRQVHGYIAESLLRFPDSAHLVALCEGQGLVLEKQQRLFGGMMQLVQLVKHDKE
ncbi:MAG: methyltransferase domain-containing protein [Deltaproteobacteria bacterium]|nr:MAG: methyltransferase domain-containing protein [Deltaproteobacteria bacterium]